MELMKQVLQNYCNEKGHRLEENGENFRIYFKHEAAYQVDIYFLVECANKYGWHFYIASDYDNRIYAFVYEAPTPLAA